MKFLKAIFLLLTLSTILSCSEQENFQSLQPPIMFQSGDECHVCGMIITRFPGPKGQAFDKRGKQIRKFCSTVDLLSWYLQPENKSNVVEIYVHDMAQIDWRSPDDTKLINARKATYVLGSNRKGSMGNTIASFKKLSDADNFILKFGGSLINFNQLTVDILVDIN